MTTIEASKLITEPAKKVILFIVMLNTAPEVAICKCFKQCNISKDMDWQHQGNELLEIFETQLKVPWAKCMAFGGQLQLSYPLWLLKGRHTRPLRPLTRGLRMLTKKPLRPLSQWLLPRPLILSRLYGFCALGNLIYLALPVNCILAFRLKISMPN